MGNFTFPHGQSPTGATNLFLSDGTTPATLLSAGQTYTTVRARIWSGWSGYLGANRIAAACAIEIQRTLAKRNHDVTAERHIAIKIGIHIGDVVHRDGDVYGDGVNIASRIEQLAGAGGICVSTDVERQIRNALEARFEKFGSADLKNIKLPMELFRIILPWEPASKAEQATNPKKSRFALLTATAAVVLVALLFGWWFMQRSARDSKSFFQGPSKRGCTRPARGNARPRRAAAPR